MRHVIAILVISAFCLMSVHAAEHSGTAELKIPPTDLDANYPPKSESMPYLNNMFSLSIAMTGTFTNMVQGDWGQAARWAERVEASYLKIGELVPAWKDRLDTDAAKTFVTAVSVDRDMNAARKAGEVIGGTCGKCHNDYEVTANLMFHYRPFDADMKDPVTGRTVQPDDYMKLLTDSYKHVAIYLADSEKDKAAAAADELGKRLSAMPKLCEECHDVDVAPIFFGTRIEARMEAVMTGIDESDSMAVQESLGWIGYNNCARCHYVHRTPLKLREKIYDARQ